MSSGWRFLVPLMVGVTVPAASSLIEGRLARLRAVPPAERIELEKNLARFRSLPSPQREAIRRLDRELESLPAAERERLLGTLERFRNWLDRQPEETRRQLLEAEPSERLRLVAAHREPARPASAVDRTRWTKSAALNPIPLFEASYLLRIWAALNQGQRAEVERQPSLRERQAMLEALGRELGVGRDPALVEEFRVGVEELRRRLGPRAAEMRFGAEELLQPSPPNGRPPAFVAKAQAQSERVRGFLFRNLETRWSASPAGQIDQKPAAELAGFEALLPAWYRETLDPLPPEIARDRVNRLYFLVSRDPALLESLRAATRQSPSLPPASAAPPTGAAKPF